MASLKSLEAGESVILLNENGAVYRAVKSKGRAWQFEADDATFTSLVFPPEAIVTVIKTSDDKFIGFRSSFAEGRALQSAKDSTIQFDNHNFGNWEQWSVAVSSGDDFVFTNKQFPKVKLQARVQWGLTAAAPLVLGLDAFQQQKRKVRELEAKVSALEAEKSSLKFDVVSLRMRAGAAEAAAEKRRVEEVETAKAEARAAMAQAVSEREAAVRREMDEATAHRLAAVKAEMMAASAKWLEEQVAAAREEVRLASEKEAEERIAAARAEEQEAAAKLVVVSVRGELERRRSMDLKPPPRQGVRPAGLKPLKVKGMESPRPSKGQPLSPTTPTSGRTTPQAASPSGKTTPQSMSRSNSAKSLVEIAFGGQPTSPAAPKKWPFQF